jgi:hypothetical protein
MTLGMQESRNPGEDRVRQPIEELNVIILAFLPSCIPYFSPEMLPRGSVVGAVGRLMFRDVAVRRVWFRA